MKRFLIEFSYNGSEYLGYQKQQDKKTIQQEIEKALEDINNKKAVKLHSSGRTDKGVHAISQVAHFDIDIKIDSYHLKSALNGKLSDSIFIKQVKEVSSDFHARYMVKSKTYVYKINTGLYNPIERKYIYQYNKDLDIKKIKQALKLFKGTHDFNLFTPKTLKKENTIRTIYNTKVIKKDNYIYLYFTGSGFLKYQVRYMMGLIFDICEKKKEIKDLKNLLSNNGDKGIRISPPEGLYLEKVKY